MVVAVVGEAEAGEGLRHREVQEASNKAGRRNRSSGAPRPSQLQPQGFVTPGVSLSSLKRGWQCLLLRGLMGEEPMCKQGTGYGM